MFLILFNVLFDFYFLLLSGLLLPTSNVQIVFPVGIIIFMV